MGDIGRVQVGCVTRLTTKNEACLSRTGCLSDEMKQMNYSGYVSIFLLLAYSWLLF